MSRRALSNDGGRLPNPVCDHAYMINIASCANGVGYGKWVHIDGFSENVLRWIIEYEHEGSSTSLD